MNRPDYEIRVIGTPRAPFRDFYHGLMRLSWPSTLAAIALVYVALNAVFATVFLAIGGLEHARPGSWADAFFFSVQTMGTIGYGAMWPASTAANILVVVESVVSIVFTALATGLVFAKFSLPSARLMFTHNVTISKMNGVPSLSLRVSNQRANNILEADVRMAITRTEKTLEGRTFYRMVDLKLVRDHVLSLSRSWTILHVIDETSPLFGETPESLAQKEAELQVSVTGTDDLWMQPVYASHLYMWHQIAWNQRHKDILSEQPDALIMDLTQFHELEAAD